MKLEDWMLQPLHEHTYSHEIQIIFICIGISSCQKTTTTLIKALGLVARSEGKFVYRQPVPAK